MKMPTLIQSAVLVVCGLVLALFGCLGAIAGIGNGSSEGPFFYLGGAVFFLGLLGAFIGALAIVVVVVRLVFQSLSTQRKE
jgi:hypothetical protein